MSPKHEVPQEDDMTKLNRRNAGSAYGTHAHGLDFHIYRESGQKGWAIVVRPLTETAGVVHSLGQPEVITESYDRLSDIRAIIAEFGSVEGYDRDPWGRWMQASRIVFDREHERICAEYDAAVNARTA